MEIAVDIHLIPEFIASFTLVVRADVQWRRTVIDMALGARLAHAFGLRVQLEWLYLHGFIGLR